MIDDDFDEDEVFQDDMREGLREWADYLIETGRIYQ